MDSGDVKHAPRLSTPPQEGNFLGKAEIGEAGMTPALSERRILNVILYGTSHPELYNLASDFLQELESASDKKAVRDKWEKKFSSMGYGPLDWNGNGWGHGQS